MFTAAHNGAAYRSHSLQGICARLSIELIYCRPYAPEGKGKLERWHRTLRDQFLTELQPQKIYTLDEINGLLWAWVDQLYHTAPHHGLEGKTPLAVWQNHLEMVQPLGTLAHGKMDSLKSLMQGLTGYWKRRESVCLPVNLGWAKQPGFAS